MITQIGGVLLTAYYFNSYAVLGGSFTAITPAITSVIDQGIIRRSPAKLDLVYFGNAVKLADKILRFLPESVSVTVTDGLRGQPWTHPSSSFH